jgi:hypothetical protein
MAQSQPGTVSKVNILSQEKKALASSATASDAAGTTGTLSAV